jgi:hypothetical protein
MNSRQRNRRGRNSNTKGAHGRSESRFQQRGAGSHQSSRPCILNLAVQLPRLGGVAVEPVDRRAPGIKPRPNPIRRVPEGREAAGRRYPRPRQHENLCA